MKIKGKHAWAVLIVAGMIMFSGCCGLFGGGGNPTTTLTGGGGTEVTTTTAGGSHVTTTTQAGGGNLLGGVSFDSLMNLVKPAGYTITYDVTAAGQTQAMKYYFSGQTYRLDMTTNAEGKSVEARFYQNADGSFICTKADAAWSCIGGKTEETPSGETGQGVDLDDLQSSLKSETGVPIYEGTQLIAGVTAPCFKVESGGDVIRYCSHPAYNVPLLAESADLTAGQEGYYKMVATSFSASTPPASTFTLPAQPTDLSDMCAQACGMLPAEQQTACMANCKT